MKIQTKHTLMFLDTKYTKTENQTPNHMLKRHD